ncbi:hypothetical protein [Methanosphaerula subterraneus]
MVILVSWVHGPAGVRFGLVVLLKKSPGGRRSVQLGSARCRTGLTALLR